MKILALKSNKGESTSKSRISGQNTKDLKFKISTTYSQYINYFKIQKGSCVKPFSSLWLSSRNYLSNSNFGERLQLLKYAYYPKSLEEKKLGNDKENNIA